jgi:hypothetical protein
MVPVPIKKIGFRHYQGSEKNQYAFELRIQQQRLNNPHDPLPHILYIYFGDKNGITQLINERHDNEEHGEWRVRRPKNINELQGQDLLITTTMNDEFSNFEPSKTILSIFDLLFSQFDEFCRSHESSQSVLFSESLMNEPDLVSFQQFFNCHFPEWLKFEKQITELAGNIALDHREILIASQPYGDFLKRLRRE